ncbi:MAG: MFS transporter [Candidatus Binatia bacterium]
MRKEERTVLIVVCLGTFFHIQSMGSINVSLSAIQKDFTASLAAVQWIGLMGAVSLSSLSLAFGRAGDLIGRTRVFKIGLSLYTLGAGLAAFSGSFSELLAFRCVMATGLAMSAPLAGAIIASVFPHESRGQALGLLTASIALGRTTGPTIGGFILQLWGWRAVFLANFLFGIPTCLILFRVLRGADERRAGSFDFLGALSLIIGFPSLLIALTLGARTNWESPEIVFWFAAAAAGLASFVRQELRAGAPLMNLFYFKDRSLATALLSLVLATLAFYPVTIFGPLYMRNVIEASPLWVGFAMAALPFCTTLFSPLSGRLADRLNARWVAMLGLCLILSGLYFYARLGVGSTMAGSVLVLSVLGAGIGLFVPATEKMAFATVPSRDYGMLSAMLTSFGTGSGALGTAIAVALAEAARGGAAIEDAAGFAHSQQFAFASLLPLAVLAVLVTLAGRSRLKG